MGVFVVLLLLCLCCINNAGYYDVMEFNVKVELNLPQPRSDSSVVVYEDEMFICGGIGKCMKTGLLIATEECLVYGEEKFEKKMVDTLASPRFDHSMAFVEDSIYVIGGSQLVDGEFVFLDSIEKFCPTRKVFDRNYSKNLPIPLGKFGLISYPEKSSNRMIIFGGLTIDQTYQNKVYEFDPSSGEVNEIGELPTVLAEHCVVYLDSKVFVIGGSIDGKATDKVYQVEFNEENDELNFIESRAKVKYSRRNFACSSVGDKIFIAGGWNNDTAGNNLFVKEVEMFDGERFQLIGELIIPRDGAIGVKFNKQFYVIGGHSFGDILSVIEMGSMKKIDRSVGFQTQYYVFLAYIITGIIFAHAIGIIMFTMWSQTRAVLVWKKIKKVYSEKIK